MTAGEIGFALLIAILAMMLCSRSSLLSPFNNWDDVNSYFSMGKALFNGKVIYRDILDQKGPFLYFFYGLGYLLSHQDFRGVLVIEILVAAIFLYGCLRIMKLYMKAGLTYIFLPLLASVIYSSVSFWWGGSAEELCMPYFVWPLYFMLKYFKEDGRQGMGRKEIAVCGLCAGMVALIKFNSLGFFMAYMLVVVLLDLQQREWKRMLENCCWFLGWMFLPFLPWILYFAMNQSLSFWYQGYLYYNVFLYADFSDETVTIGSRAYKLAKILYWLIREHMQYFLFIIMGMLHIILHPKRKWMEKIAVCFLAFFLFLGIYVGGVELKYYSMPLTVFTVLGFCTLGSLAERLGKKDILENKKVTGIAAAAGIVVSGIIMTTLSLNTEYMKQEKEDLYLYQLYSAMEVKEDTTLLNISCFDVGLYTISGIVPNCYWFQTQTLPIEDVVVDQSRYIREGKTDYIVAREYYPAEITQGYELIATQKEEERGFTYYLFRKKGL